MNFIFYREAFEFINRSGDDVTLEDLDSQKFTVKVDRKDINLFVDERLYYLLLICFVNF